MRRISNVIVVLLMLIVCLGLLTPAVYRVRQASNRIRCGNNLSQIGMAVNMYYHDHKRLPFAAIPNRNLPPERRLSWLWDIRCYIEGGTVRPDETTAWDDQENRLEVIMPVPTYQCPATAKAWPRNAAAVTHYVGIAGVSTDAASLPIDDPRTGCLGFNRITRWKDIKDGTSTTMLAAETASANGPWTAGGHATVRGLDPDRPPYLGERGQFSTQHRTAGTFSTGMLFADRSVRFFNQSTDPVVLKALATIAGGESVELPPE